MQNNSRRKRKKLKKLELKKKFKKFKITNIAKLELVKSNLEKLIKYFYRFIELILKQIAKN